MLRSVLPAFHAPGNKARREKFMKQHTNRPDENAVVPPQRPASGEVPGTETAHTASQPEAASEPAQAHGVKWLRHTGVGPARKATGKPANSIVGASVTALGSLEAEIMGILWEIGRPANGMEVAEASLYRRRAQGQEPIAFATVNTTLRRLADKGVLTSRKGGTRTPYYAPTVERMDMAARILNNVSQTLLGKPLHDLMPRFVGDSGQEPIRADAGQREIAELMNALADAARAFPADPDTPPAEGAGGEG